MRERRDGVRRAPGRVVAALAAALVAAATAAQPLPSWNDGPAKRAIVQFVTDATTPGHPAFVPAAERIAVFDNDGALWSEQPMYFQLAFAIDGVKALAPLIPERKDRQPFRAALEGDVKALAATGEHGLLALVTATRAGTTSEEFAQVVRDWAATARHPTIGRPYTELTYTPMRELPDCLRASTRTTATARSAGSAAASTRPGGADGWSSA